MKDVYEIYEDYKPGPLSWLTALICTGLLIYLVNLSDRFMTGVHSAGIRARLNNLIEKNIRPDIILEDQFIKSKPDKAILKIQKTVALYNSIYGENYESAKIIVEEPTKNPSKSLSQLREVIKKLTQIQKDLKIPAKAHKVPSEKVQKKMKANAIKLARDLLRQESLPKVGAIAQMTYEAIKNEI